MLRPDECDPHDFRRVFARHITGQDPTDPKGEGVLFVICCHCGKSPIFFTHLGQTLPLRSSPRGDWPDELQITEYEWDRGEGPSVTFVERR